MPDARGFDLEAALTFEREQNVYGPVAYVTHSEQRLGQAQQLVLTISYDRELDDEDTIERTFRTTVYVDGRLKSSVVVAQTLISEDG